MARGRNRRSNPQARRVAFVNANPAGLPRLASPPRSFPKVRTNFERLPGQLELPLTVFEDRRQFHPQGPTRPAASISKSRHRLKVRPDPWKQTKATLLFDTPDKVLVCVRRGIRKEVMHAIGKAGKRGQKKPRRSEYSSISCKE